MAVLDSLNQLTFTRKNCYRLIPSRFPPVHLFEDVANPDDFEALFAVQAMTNPRIQEEIGNINLVPPQERIFGVPGCGYIMAAFTHVNPDGSRFSNGDYGLYYASENLETAIAETVYHRERFLGYTKEPPQEIDMRSLTAEFSANLYNLLHLNKTNHQLYDRNDYSLGQQLGKKLKQQGGDGFIYHSVRVNSDKDNNFALFKPKTIHQCKQGGHYTYIWNGEKISAIYKKSSSRINHVNSTILLD
ncbi:RES family NAD+ phosphorylase [Legionella fairfieldensis]|uniref:RES family NAD+ phosphorylase n=1 Tax=Legionella fairfieldensis TaxID=45064 RepID=UPI00068779B2|nr:RES family NAD+ phosphorylase [Legionella fairfieldensis]